MKCKHGFPLCAHGQCALDCDSRECEPSLAHEYACDCATLFCSRSPSSAPCRGECGCGGCRRAYIDAADGPS